MIHPLNDLRPANTIHTRRTFDVNALTSGIGTTAQLIDAIHTVVADDYCGFNVQVVQTTTNPANSRAERNALIFP